MSLRFNSRELYGDVLVKILFDMLIEMKNLVEVPNSHLHISLFSCQAPFQSIKKRKVSK